MAHALTLENVLVERDDDFATITMNRPERRNALSLAHLRDLITAFADIGDSDASGIILAGAGPVFSAGHDFADVAGADLAGVRVLLDTCLELMQLIQSVPQVVLARVHGLATAAGCQLVATCDLAVAAESAAFAAPGGKGGWFCHTPMVAIARNVGRKRAAELALTGDPISAEQALDWGLINRVVPDARSGRGGARTAGPSHPRQPRLEGARQDHAVRAAVARPGRGVPAGHRRDGRVVADRGRARGHGRVLGEAPAQLAGLTYASGLGARHVRRVGILRVPIITKISHQLARTNL